MEDYQIEQISNALDILITGDPDERDMAEDEIIEVFNDYCSENGLDPAKRQANIQSFVKDLGLTTSPTLESAFSNILSGTPLTSVQQNAIQSQSKVMNGASVQNQAYMQQTINRAVQQISNANNITRNTTLGRGGSNNMPDALITKLDVNTTISEFESYLTNQNVTFQKALASAGSGAMSRTGYKYQLTDSQGTTAQLQVFVTLNDPNVLELKNIMFRSGSFFTPVLPSVVDVFVQLAKVNKGSVAAYADGYSYIVEQGKDVQAKLAVLPANFNVGEILEDQVQGAASQDEDTIPTKFLLSEFVGKRPDLKQQLVTIVDPVTKANMIAQRALQERQMGAVSGYELSDVLYQCKLIGMTDQTGLTIINLTRD